MGKVGEGLSRLEKVEEGWRRLKKVDYVICRQQQPANEWMALAKLAHTSMATQTAFQTDRQAGRQTDRQTQTDTDRHRH